MFFIFLQYIDVWLHTRQYDTIQYNAIQYNKNLFKHGRIIQYFNFFKEKNLQLIMIYMIAVWDSLSL